MNKAAFNKNYYNIFKVCTDFRQRLEQLQRLKPNKPQSKRKKDVK